MSAKQQSLLNVQSNLANVIKNIESNLFTRIQRLENDVVDKIDSPSVQLPNNTNYDTNYYKEKYMKIAKEIEELDGLENKVNALINRLNLDPKNLTFTIAKMPIILKKEYDEYVKIIEENGFNGEYPDILIDGDPSKPKRFQYQLTIRNIIEPKTYKNPENIDRITIYLDQSGNYAKNSYLQNVFNENGIVDGHITVGLYNETIAEDFEEYYKNFRKKAYANFPIINYTNNYLDLPSKVISGLYRLWNIDVTKTMLNNKDSAVIYEKIVSPYIRSFSDPTGQFGERFRLFEYIDKEKKTGTLTFCMLKDGMKNSYNVNKNKPITNEEISEFRFPYYFNSNIVPKYIILPNYIFHKSSDELVPPLFLPLAIEKDENNNPILEGDFFFNPDAFNPAFKIEEQWKDPYKQFDNLKDLMNDELVKKNVLFPKN